MEILLTFFTNDPSYTNEGNGHVLWWSDRSYITNTIIVVVRSLTSYTDTVQVTDPSGLAAFDIWRSTIHPFPNMSVKTQIDLLLNIAVNENRAKTIQEIQGITKEKARQISFANNKRTQYGQLNRSCNSRM